MPEDVNGLNQEPEMGSEMPGADIAPTGGDVQAELERTRKALVDANREAAKRRKQLEAYEAAEAERKQAQMTELEKAQAALAEVEKRATEAERGRKQALVRAAVIARAGALRFVNPEDAIAFLGAESLEIGEDGQIADLDEQLTKLTKARPYLLQQPGQLGATNPGRGGAQGGETDQERRRRLFGGGAPGNPFTGDGGGVLFEQ